MALSRITNPFLASDKSLTNVSSSAANTISVFAGGNERVRWHANGTFINKSTNLGTATPTHALHMYVNDGTGAIVTTVNVSHDFTTTSVPYSRALGIGIINHNSGGISNTSVRPLSSQWKNSSYGAYIGTWTDIDTGSDGQTNAVGHMVRIHSSNQPNAGYIAYQADLANTASDNGHGSRYGIYVSGEASNYFSGNVGIGGGTSAPGHKLVISGDVYGQYAIYTAHNSTTTGKMTENFHGDVMFHYCDAGGWNAANCAVKLAKVAATGRSLAAAGTVAQNGADYAEYMKKNGDFTISKGDICGVDSNGELTISFGEAITFVVKSTNPGLVGGDSWGFDALGEEPELEVLTYPEKPVAEDYEDKDAYGVALSQWTETIKQMDSDNINSYNTTHAEYMVNHEIERQKVDRIAFCGQVPVNVTGATPGQYIVPVDDGGTIKGIAVTNPTFDQYKIAVGKVIAVEPDGRAKIIVKIS